MSSYHLPTQSHYINENTTQSFFSLLNISSLSEAREVPYNSLIAANTAQIRSALHGTFLYVPVADGSYVPTLPGLSFLSGNFNENISMLLGHSENECVLFAPPRVESNDQFASYIRDLIPGIQPEVVKYIVQELYPNPSSDGEEPAPGRANAFIGDFSLICQTNYAARAFLNQTYNYQFSIHPALHGWDLEYLFFSTDGTQLSSSSDDSGEVGVIQEPLARQLRGYVTNFVKGGDPNSDGLVEFPVQGGAGKKVEFGSEGVSVERDGSVGERCQWMQKGLYM